MTLMSAWRRKIPKTGNVIFVLFGYLQPDILSIARCFIRLARLRGLFLHIAIMSHPCSPSQLLPSWQQWHYNCLTAEVELLRRENRSLRQTMELWHDGRKQALLDIENLRRTVALLPLGMVDADSPLESAKATSPLSPATTDKLYRMYECG